MNTIISNDYRVWLAPTALACSDVVAVVLSAITCILVRYALGGNFELSLYANLWPVLPLFVLAYAGAGAYKVLMPSPLELKRCTLATTFVFVLLASLTFWSRTAHEYSRLIMLSSCVMAWVVVPAFRRRCRELMGRFDNWRRPAIIFGGGEVVHAMIRSFSEHPSLGLEPVAIIDDCPDCNQQDFMGIKRYSKDDIPALAKRYRCAYFIIGKPTLTLEQYQAILKSVSKYFRKIVIAPDIFRPASIWADVVDINGILGLETGQKLLAPLPRFYKRAIDVICSALGLLVLSPFLLLVCITIKATSKGSVFYFHERIGLNGNPFKLWKFRTMVKDASRALEKHLETNPALRAEWKAEQKLAMDPRVTRFGSFLRKWSIDELPQLVNVLIGDMSLVGPRPIVATEIKRYADSFSLYKKVAPGMTGLWQVSGRNAVSYDRRVEMDVYYIRNWSIWFDLYILTRTPSAVFKRRGAM